MDNDQLGALLTEKHKLTACVAESKELLSAFASELTCLADDLARRPTTVFFDGAPDDIQRIPDAILGKVRYRWALLASPTKILQRLQTLRDDAERIKQIDAMLTSGPSPTIKMDWDKFGEVG